MAGVSSMMVIIIVSHHVVARRALCWGAARRCHWAAVGGALGGWRVFNFPVKNI